MESRLFRNVGNISSQYGVLSENAEIPFKLELASFARLLSGSAVCNASIKRQNHGSG